MTRNHTQSYRCRLRAYDHACADDAALEIAYQQLNCPIPLEDVLKSRALTIVLENVARRHMEKRARLDVKKLQANDQD